MPQRGFPEDVDVAQLLRCLSESPDLVMVGDSDEEAELWMKAELASRARGPRLTPQARKR